MAKKYFLFAGLAFLLAVGAKLTYFSVMDPILFNDVDGNIREIGGSRKPAAVGFWIDNCRYSDRMLQVLKKISARYSTQQLDVIAFYANPTTNEAIKASKPRDQFPFILAAAQQRRDLIENLHSSFQIRGGGSNLYLVDSRGKIFSIDTSKLDESQNEILLKFEKLLHERVPDLIASSVGDDR